MKKNNIPIVFYIHIPFCPTWCKFCHFFLDWWKKTWYIDLLKKEYSIKYWKKKLKIKCIHIGWWTPNMLSLSEMWDLLDFLNNKLYWFEEFSIELHPALLSFEYLDLLKSKWINRVSFWIQSLDEEILKNHTRVDLNYFNLGKYLDYSKKLWFQKINFDFIYDLIWDSLENINKNLNFIKKYKPTSVNYYLLRLLTKFLKDNHSINLKRRFVFYLYIKNFFIKNDYIVKNDSIYFLKEFWNWKNFLYEDIVYTKQHNLYWLWVSATSDIWGEFRKNSINYDIYRKNIINWNVWFDLTFKLDEIPYLLYRFYYLILMYNSISIDMFDTIYWKSSLNKIINYIKKIEKIWLIKIDLNNIYLTNKWIFYFEKIEEILFLNFKEEYELLKKL